MSQSETLSLPRLNIGCGKNPLPNCINLDAVALPHVDVVFDLETCGLGNPLPFPDDSFDHITAHHILEHITHILPLMQELHRVARPGATFEIHVPHLSNDMAFDDPQHVRQFGIGAWQFFAQSAYKRADYNYRGDWITQSIALIMDEEVASRFPSRDDAETAAFHGRNFINEMRVTLIAEKPAREPGNAVEHYPEITIQVARKIVSGAA